MSVLGKRMSGDAVADRQRNEQQESRPAQRRSGPREGQIVDVDIERLHRNPFQPRIYFDPQQLAELAASIRESGLLQPPTIAEYVDENSGEQLIVIVAGERRVLASEKAGLTSIKAIDYGLRDAAWLSQMALVENLNRADLKVYERIRGYLSLAEHLEREEHPGQRTTIKELSTKTGESQQRIGEYLKVSPYAELMDEMEARTMNGENPSLQEYLDRIKELEANKLRSFGVPKEAMKKGAKAKPAKSAPDVMAPSPVANYDYDNYEDDLIGEDGDSKRAAGQSSSPQLSRPTLNNNGATSSSRTSTSRDDTHPIIASASTIQFKGTYIDLLQLAEILNELTTSIMTAELDAAGTAPAPYHVEEVFRNYDELGMALKSKLAKKK